MAKTLFERDYLNRNLVNATPGTSAATDFLARDIVLGQTDFLGRQLLSKVTVTAWAASTAYSVGDLAELSGGEGLVATVAGTSAASEPTAPGYGDTVVDGTVTWEQVT